MKLELKHLAPYLPYGLKAQAPKNGKIILLKGMYGNTLDFLDEEDGHYTYSLDYAKIILRPLSDLTKEIEHNGKKIIFTHDILTHHEIDLMEINKTIRDLPVSGIPYQKVQMMLKHHYDVFGLIEAGLAIDINTLKEIV